MKQNVAAAVASVFNPEITVSHGLVSVCVVVTDKGAIQALDPMVADLLNRTGQSQDVTLTLEYFLRRNELRGAPILVQIREGERLVALLYGRERRVLGIRTGLAQFGDYYGDACVIAEEGFRATAVARGALKVLELPRIHTVCASFKLIDESEISKVAAIVGQGEVRLRMLPEAVQHTLELKDTFDDFLKTLGSHTRRNLRVYRRRVEQKGWKFIARLDGDQMAAAFHQLKHQQGKHKSSGHYLNCCQDVLKAVPGALFAGICTTTGEWVSLTAGWLRNDRYFMLVQLNDARRSQDSISTVMRSYLIEDLIGCGVKSINFVGGSSELLRRFCLPQSCGHFLFEKKGMFREVKRFVVAQFCRHSMLSRIVQSS
jgi:hypothetical protein